MNIRLKKMSFLVQGALSAGIAASLAGFPANAQQDPEKVEKIEVTGSSIRRINAETALPVTILKAEDLRKAGVTTAEQAIGRIAASQSSIGISQGIGSTTGGRSNADLRGLGGEKTLVLLNGRRVANHAYDSGTVDLNSIPFAAIERIEILRDGASAIYGTDAIGGVINFITKNDYAGAGFSGEAQLPQHSGGEMLRGSLSGGLGSLDKDGYNIFATADVRTQEALKSTQRDFSASGRALGLSSGTTFPGNFSQAGGIAGNPTLPNCAQPASYPNGAGSSCRFDFPAFIDNIPQNDQVSFLGRGSMKLGVNVASLEYMRAENKSTNRVAPTPLTGIAMPANSPYYPGKGITPAGQTFTIDPVTELPVATPINPTLPLSVGWRTIPAGQRTNVSQAIGERAILGIDGSGAGWDYKSALFWNRNSVADDFTNGYISSPGIRAGVAGTVPGQPGLFLNPFGAPTPTEDAYIQSNKIIGEVINAQGVAKGFDVRGSRELVQLAGGPMGLALGGEYRKENFNFTLNEPLVRQAASSGLELAQSVSGNRNVSAVFAEMSLPFTKWFEGTLAVRHDRYSDFGSTTNPKIGFRIQPNKLFLVRASYNTGFRAPTLYEINQPEQVTFTSDAYDDPLLCPGGVPNVGAGADPARDCQQQFQTRQAGSKTLDPEKSKTFTVGFVFEPTNSLSMGLDFWDIKLKDQIGVLPEQAIFGDTAKYAARFIRCSALDAATQTALNCLTPNQLGFLDQPNENLGEIKTRGVDLNVNYRFPISSFGRFTTGYDGTYVSKYDYQRERGGVFVENVGKYTDATPIFRWQHTFSLNWNAGGWSSLLANRYKAGYEDQDPTSEPFKVKAYSTWDTSVSYATKEGLSLTFGIKNLFDKDPPATNQGSTFQVGYDPRFTDPLGRTFNGRVQYDFK